MMDTGPTFVNVKNKRFLMNLYNQRWLSLGVDNPYSSNTYSVPDTTGWQGWVKSATTWKAEFVSLGLDLVTARATATIQSYGNQTGKIGIGLDSASVDSSEAAALVYTDVAGYFEALVQARYEHSVSSGYHYLLPLQGYTGSNSNLAIWLYQTTFGQTYAASFSGRIRG